MPRNSDVSASQEQQISLPRELGLVIASTRNTTKLREASTRPSHRANLPQPLQTRSTQTPPAPDTTFSCPQLNLPASPGFPPRFRTLQTFGSTEESSGERLSTVNVLSAPWKIHVHSQSPLQLRLQSLRLAQLRSKRFSRPEQQPSSLGETHAEALSAAITETDSAGEAARDTWRLLH